MTSPRLSQDEVQHIALIYRLGLSQEEIETLRHSWNEHIIASYPTTTAFSPRGPFAYPFVLPDQSGVIFNAGWPGEKHGVYLAEWPSELS